MLLILFDCLNFRAKNVCTAVKTECYLQNKQSQQLFNYDVISQHTKNTILRSFLCKNSFLNRNKALIVVTELLF